MESVCEKKFVQSTGRLKNDENSKNEFKSSKVFHSVSNSSDSVYNSIQQSKYFKGIKFEASQDQKVKSSKISTVLDTICKTNILDESADFVHCESMSKFKNNKKESTESVKSTSREILSCEICKEDITHLDVYSRAVHVNSCIDRQISTSPEPKIQISETENVFILECPLCFKHFSSSELRSSHIKKCGKSKGLSTQSIIKALELQEKHALERISLGLPAKPIKPAKSHKSAVSKRAIVEPKNKTESDIQLAKALSLSLTNSNKQNEEESSGNITVVTLKPPTANQYPGKKAKKIISTPLLVLRTEQERKKLLLDKVATIVTPQNPCEDYSPMDSESSFEQKNEDPCVLPLLWQLSGKALEKHAYYVENLLDWIQPSDAEVGAKLYHLSQIAGHEIVTQLPCDYTFNSQEAQEQSCMEYTEPPDSSPSLIGSLRSLVASSWMSDVDIHTICGTVIPAHRLLLAVRCPPLKQDLDFCSRSGKISLKWESTSFDAALQFLNFIYTDNIEIEEDMKSDLLYLANKYEVSDLQALLLANQKMNKQSEVESNQSQDLGYKDTSLPFLPQIQSQESKLENSLLHETQEDTNMNLEIVYNCITSSLKPSQPYINESFSFVSAVSSHSEFRNNSQLSSALNYNESESFADSPKNCAIPAHKTSTSPVIFDVSENEMDDNSSENEMDDNSDNESVELPVNCSQKSVLKECNIDERELDLSSTESNSSQDSVQFLQSSFSVYSSLYKSPVKVKDDILSASLKCLISPLKEESSSSLSDSSTDLQKSVVKYCRQKTEVSVSSDLHSDGYANLESPVSSHLKCSSSLFIRKDQPCNDINVKEKSTLSSLDNTTVVDQDHELEITEEVCTHHLRDKSTRLHSFISQVHDRDFGDDIIPMKSSSVNQSNLLSTPKQSRYVENCSSLRNTSSPEVLICDSDSDSKSPISIPCERLASCHQVDEFPQYQMKHSFSSVGVTEMRPKISMIFQESKNFPEKTSKSEDTFVFQTSPSDIPSDSLCNIFFKRNAENPKVIFYSSDEDDTSNHKKHLLSNEKCELKEKFSYTNLSKEVGSSMQVGSPRSSPIPFERFDDDPHYEYFEPLVFSPSTPKVTELHSPTNAKVTELHSPKNAKVTELHSPKNAKGTELHSSANAKFIKDNHITQTATPSSNIGPQFQLTDSPITPFPDYKNMVTPEIKQALRKIGVKALPRKKAVALLSHVYNETHPMINEKINARSSPKKTSKSVNLKKRKNLNENVTKPPKRQQTEVHCSEVIKGTQDSDDSSSENPEWEGCVPEITFSQFTQDSPSKDNKDVIDLIKQYIQSNEELYNNILTYTPLNLVTFHQELKDNSIKISIQKLMDFCDEQCITFTCPRKEEYRKKQTARTQRFRKNMIAKFSQQST